MAPPKISDPCLNLLHFPPGIQQTAHSHPSVRCGLIASGAGFCMAEGGRVDLKQGMVWAIPKDTVHAFHTEQESLQVIAYHPDTDWGPRDEDHPMLNRTWVDGLKIDNTTAMHQEADVLLTEQELTRGILQKLRQDGTGDTWGCGIAAGPCLGAVRPFSGGARAWPALARHAPAAP